MKVIRFPLRTSKGGSLTTKLLLIDFLNMRSSMDILCGSDQTLEIKLVKQSSHPSR